MALLSIDDKKQLEQTIRNAEKNTSGEIVLLYKKNCGGYVWVYAAWAFLGWAIATGAAAYGAIAYGEFSVWRFLEWQLAGISVGCLLSFCPALSRSLVPASEKSAKVHRAALAAFTSHGVFETRDRTGILLCVSEFERRVEILADKGIHTQLGETYWKGQSNAIALGMRRREAVRALTQAIESMGAELARYFPRRTDDTNELPDGIRDE
jgi:putative membrane protein